MTRVLVVGSINMDLVVRTGSFPRLGETLLGEAFATYPGGKGANQAVAAARLGASVSLIGCVGNDAFGDTLLAGLASEGVDTRWISRVTEATGVAMITVCGADNAIIVVPGANHALTPAHLDAAGQAFADADIVLAQLEVPRETVEHAARLAEKYGKPFVLNPAPAMPLSEALLSRVSLLTPNEYELSVALGGAEDDWPALLARLPGRAVMTRGKEGACFVASDGTLRHQPGYEVTAVDSTGAGDTFNGALATFLPLGLAEAVRRANAAGALSVTRPGAQGGMPELDQLTGFLERQP
ncbi:ribokinase [Paludibacterium paludis]|uniref:Ribokinase n=1 Tax=Paludibacterium paludis TaxID=1225769 RepID=A0A918P478_9NEIS|nr:ribokinase [Paludibacterium paludis]GGY18337.1 ribokinase [Paludibacterium paludis]